MLDLLVHPMNFAFMLLSGEVAPTEGSVLIAVTALNTLGVFALLFKAGHFVGKTTERLDALENDSQKYDDVVMTLQKHGESLARLEGERHHLIWKAEGGA